MRRRTYLGTCCGCFSFRQGAIVSLGVGLVVGLIIVFLFVYLAFDPMSITQAIVRESMWVILSLSASNFRDTWT